MILVSILVIALMVVAITYYFFQPMSSSFVSKSQIGAYATEYPTHSVSTSPNAITVDSAGVVWFSLWNDSSIAELIPANGTIHEYHVPGLKSGSMITWGMSADDSSGLIWFTEESSNSVWSFNVNNRQFNQHELATPNSFPFGLTIDKNHNVWFAELEGNKIGEISASGSLAEFPVPAPNSEPSGITTDSSGKVWFSLPGIDSIGSYFDGNFTIQNLTGLVTTPVGIAIDPQGNAWMTQHGPSFISEFNPTSHYFRTISTSNNSLVVSLPYFCWIDQNGNVWFNEHQGNAMSEFQPTSDTMIEYFIPSRVEGSGNISYMLTSAVSPGGQPWYTELLTGKVGTVNTSKALDVNILLQNYSRSISIPNGSETSLGLSIESNSSSASLKAYVGNYTGNFSFTFTPEHGKGSFNSVVEIQNNGSVPGVYFVTLTARTNFLAVSKIIEIRVGK